MWTVGEALLWVACGFGLGVLIGLRAKPLFAHTVAREVIRLTAQGVWSGTFHIEPSLRHSQQDDEWPETLDSVH